MKLSNKAKIELFILLIVLNLILRFSVTHHEIFYDSFEMHILANSLTESGEARWWAHPLAVIGMYPNSYASMTPFFISGISQCSGVDIEPVIFIYCIIFGLFTIFASYALAGIIYDNDLFKFLVAFGFSTSPGILAYTTWTAPARSPFMILLPLFLYALLKSRKHYLRFGMITLILALLLLATHHLAFYLIPIFAACFLVTIVYKLKEHIGVIKKLIKKSENLMPLIIIFAFCLMFAYPFLTHKFMIMGSRWDYLTYKEYLRYIGMLVFLAIGGFTYLVFKQNKRYEEWSLLFMLLFLAVFIQQQMYMKWFISIFAFLLAGVAFMNLYKLHEDEKNKKHIITVIVAILLLSVSFSGYFQFLHTYQTSADSSERHMRDDTYITGLWIKEHIMAGKGICNSRQMGFGLAATSSLPFLTGSAADDQAYGFVEAQKDFELEKNPITSEKFWLASPYERVAGTSSDGYWQMLMESEYSSSQGEHLLSKFNLTHVMENTKIQGRWVSHHGLGHANFLHSLYGEKDIIYDGGRVTVWRLN